MNFELHKLEANKTEIVNKNGMPVIHQQAMHQVLYTFKAL